MLDADQIAALIAGVVAFLVVAGWAVVRWRAVGRDPRYTDDDSVLLAAPPPGMTAATATVIDGRPSQLALTAGLLDLASRDEIGFRDEDPGAHKAHPIGVEIRGGTSDDPRIRLNRRNPVGDGEAWLLTMLRETIVMESSHGGSMDDRPDMQMDAMTAMVGFFGFEGHEAMAGATDGPGGAFVGGMTGGIPDLETMLAGMEARSGKPMSDKTRASLSRMAPMLEALRDPDAVAADPDAFIDRMAASTGKQPTDAERAEMKAYIARMVAARQRQMGGGAPGPLASPVVDPATAATIATAPMPVAASPTAAAAVDPGATMPVAASPTVAAAPPAALPYLAAAQAATFHPPLGFGTFLETYAKRHGWIASMSITRRLPWRALGFLEVVVGIVIAGVSGSAPSIGLGVGLGIAAGGVATWLIAPSMASKTMEGAMMKAQLAAYRRTLQATFTSAGVIDDSLKAAGMSWLETPDQVLVWGVALGLRDEIADLLRRSAATAASAGNVGPAAVVTELGVFEGIERIGTIVPAQHHTS
jgi:hypothetical protein